MSNLGVITNRKSDEEGDSAKGAIVGAKEVEGENKMTKYTRAAGGGESKSM